MADDRAVKHSLEPERDTQVKRVPPCVQPLHVAPSSLLPYHRGLQSTTSLAGTMQLAKSESLYERLIALPEGLTGEILNGQLNTQPRPAAPHARVEAVLQMELGGSYDRGRAGAARAAGGC